MSSKKVPFHFVLICIGILCFFSSCRNTEIKQSEYEQQGEASGGNEQQVSILEFYSADDMVSDHQEILDRIPLIYSPQRKELSFSDYSTGASLVDFDDGDCVLYCRDMLSEAEVSHYLVHVSDDEERISLSAIPANYTVQSFCKSHGAYFVTACPFTAESYSVGGKTYFDESLKSEVELFIFNKAGELIFSDSLKIILGAVRKIVTGMYQLFSDNESGVWLRLSAGDLIYHVTSEGIADLAIELPKGFDGHILSGNDEKSLMAISSAEGSISISYMYDIESQASSFYQISDFTDISQVFPGTLRDALLMDDEYLYGVDLQNNAVYELMKFSTYGVDSSAILNVSESEDGRIFITVKRRDSLEGEVVALTPFSNWGFEEDYIRVSCLSCPEYLRAAVNSYNATNPEVKVVIREYADEFGDDASLEDAFIRLRGDMIDGTAGEVVCLNGIEKVGLRKTLAESGAFVDLYELMENDPDIQMEDYFTQIWEANEIEDKLYNLVPLFSLNSKYGRTNESGNDHHVDENVFYETDDPSTVFGWSYSYKHYIHDLCVFSVGDIYDSAAAIYNTRQMESYLSVAASLPEYYTLEELGSNDELYNRYSGWADMARMVSGKVRFYSRDYSEFIMGRGLSPLREASGMLGTPNYEDKLEGIVEDPEKAPYSVEPVQTVFSGFPVKEGCGTAVIDLLSLSITSGSEKKEEAWDFLKYTLSEDFQTSEIVLDHTIPVRAEVMEDYIRNCYKEPYRYDPWYETYLGTMDPETGVPYYIPVAPMKPWVYDEFLAILDDVEIIDEADSQIEMILMEEVKKIRNGECSIPVAAESVSERVKLYAAEQN